MSFSGSTSYAKVSGPVWLSVAADGTLSGTPTNSDVGANSFTVRVTDGNTPAVEATLDIIVINTNDAPVFAANPITGTDATEDVAYAGTLAGSASDDDGDTLSYAKVNGPAWLFVAADGTISGTPTNDDVGANAFSVSVSDGTAPAVEAGLDILVINTNDLPVFVVDPVLVADATEDLSYSETIAGSAVDVDGDTLTYSKVSGPAWLAVAADGTLSGIPSNADVGSNGFTVSASDGVGVPVEAALLIEVLNTNDAPVFLSNPIAGANATEDAAYAGSLVGTAADDDGNALSFAKVSGPAWLSVAASGTLSGTPTTDDVGANTFTVSVSDGTASAVEATLNVTVEAAPSVSKLFRTTLTAVGNDSWQTVDLGEVYNSAVIVATPALPDSIHPPVVTRLRNVSGSTFDIKVERVDGQTGSVSVEVQIIAVEEGVYTLAEDGVTMEAVKYTSTVTGGKNAWAAESQTYQNAYLSPVVVGQVMTSNDANWSVFWCQGSSRTAPPSATSLATGKHLGEDPNGARLDETIDYIVIESGSGTMDGMTLVAGLGGDSVRGPENSAAGYSYSLTGLSSATSAAASLAAMDGGDGGFAVLAGAGSLTPSSINLWADEDQLNDTERKHTTEQVGYLVIE